MRANTALGWQEHWGWNNWKDSHFGSKDGRCWGLSGSLCLVNTQNQCLGVVFKVLTCIPEIRARGSCFQTQLSVGLEQLAGNGARPAQQKGDKTCQLSHLAKAGKRWRCMGPSLPLMYSSRSALAKPVFTAPYFGCHLAAKWFFSNEVTSCGMVFL